jgi:glycosyltransferase involved in cell wall biosynthesis
MNRPKISVAMCTYNGSNYIQEQLESIANQTHLPAELVVCDDGSYDDTIALIKKFAAQAIFPVRFIRNEEKLGPARNFEKAIGFCENEIIALADQDDVWMPHKLEKILIAFEQNPAATYVFSNADMIDERGMLLGDTLWNTVGLCKKIDGFSGLGQVEVLLKHNLINGASMAFRASFRSIFLPIPANWMHDYWIALLGSVLSYGVPIQEVLFKYRRHSNQVCGWRKKNLLQVIRTSLETNEEQCWEKVEHFREISERISIIPADRQMIDGSLQLLNQKEAHLSERAAIRSTSGLSRLFKVLAEASTGRYQRFSNSWHSIVRDL